MNIVQNKQTILLVGGAGYIGSHVSLELANEGHRVIILDNLHYGHPFTHPWAECIYGDYGDQALIHEVFLKNNINIVMLFAAFIEVGQSTVQPAKYYENNIIKLLSFLEIMHKHKVNKIIFSSSAAVYGMPKSEIINEDHPKKPINCYGNTKHFAELILEDYAQAYGLRFIAFRYFNVAGACPKDGLGEKHDPETHIIPRLLQAIMDEKPFFVFGSDYDTPDGTCIRDYVHVKDVAKAHVLAASQLNQEIASAYNIGTGHGRSILELIAISQTLIGKQARIIFKDRRLGDPSHLVADITKIKKQLGWQPSYTLKDCIASSYEFELIKRAAKR